MDRIDDVLETFRVGFVIAIFLINTSRVLKGIELLNECLFLIRDNLYTALGKENDGVRGICLEVHKKIFQGYKLMNDYSGAIECGRKMLVLLRKSGRRYEEVRLSLELAQLYWQQNKYEKAKEFCMNALRITPETRDKKTEGDCYAVLGIVLYSLNEYKEAEKYLQKALEIRIEVGDKNTIAVAYANLGTVFLSLSKYGKAEEYLQEALKFHIEIGDKRGEASDYGNLGTIFESLCKYEKAEDYLRKALKIQIEIGDKSGETTNYGNLGTVFQALGKYDEAEKYYRKALKMRIEIGDKSGEAVDYGNLGSVFESLCKYDKAEEYLRKALKIRIEIGDKRGEALDYANLGILFQSLGDYEKAEEYLQKALKIRVEIGDKKGEATDYGNLGNGFQARSEYHKAEEYYRKALEIEIEIGDKQGEASSYGSLGIGFQYRGKIEEAKEYHRKALKIQIEIGDKSGEATTYENLGTLFNLIGKYEEAEKYLQKALKVQTEIGDKNGEALTYGNLAVVFQSLGEYEKAEEYLRKQLQITTEIGSKQGEASCYANLGTVFAYLGKYDKAKDYYQKALLIQIEIGDKRVEASSYANMGTVFRDLGEYEKVEEYLQSALKIQIEIGDKEGQAATYVRLGTASLDARDYSIAKKYYEKSLSLAHEVGAIELQFSCHLRLALVTIGSGENILEAVSSLRESIKKSEEMRAFLKDNDNFKISFLDVHVNPYKMLSLLFSIMGKFNEALHVTELARARGLADMMSAQYSVEQELSIYPQPWVGIERIMTNSACLYVSYYDHELFLWIIKPKKPVVFRRKNVNDLFSDNGTRRTVEEVFGHKSFRNFSLLRTQEHCEDRSLFLSNVGRLAPSRPLEDDEDEDRFPEPPSLTQLHKMIIDPVADLLDQPEIIIVPEGPLYKVPFAALKDENEKYLSESFRIRIVPSLTTLRLIQDSPADYHCQTGALIVGDPDVDVVFYKESHERIRPLPCAREEAEMIGGLLGVQPLIGEHATKHAVLCDIHSASLIHFAAHGDAERGEIALAPARPFNGTPKEEHYLLTMAEIAQVRLRAKLVVLSCCHSAKGQIRSEGVVGIARAFLGSGARSVLVALWAIEDEATMNFMSRFYEHLVRGESTSESLHQAMKWMRSNGFFHVEEWAPFMLIGDNVTFDFGK